MITSLIMGGGVGSRFWPLSRKDTPKQFLKLVDQDQSMIQATVDRISDLTPHENIFIATNQNYLADIREHLPDIPEENITVEPMGKNTAACIGLASLYIERKDPQAVMVVLPSDHLIENQSSYLKILNTAVEVAKKGDNLVTIGIEPTHPETGYGYIAYDQDEREVEIDNAFAVKEFTEKPDRKAAEDFINQGNYLWNSGMFVWRVDTIRKMFKKYMPRLHKGLERMKEVIGTQREEEVLVEEFKKLDSISIDYGIMEQADNIYVVPGDFGWDDVGTWSSLERFKEVDLDGNLVEGNHIGIETKNSIIHGNGKLITTVGLDNVIIVETDDAIMVCDKDKAQDVKELRNKLKSEGYEDCL